MASETAGVSGVADRYATALYELADQQGALDMVANDLYALRRVIEENTPLKRVLGSTIIKRSARGATINAIADQIGTSPIVKNFLGVVARNGRLAALPAVSQAFSKILSARRGEILATVTVARPLEYTQIEALKDSLRRSLGCNSVTLDIWIDPALIGGLVVKVGSRRVDGSLRTKLRKLQLAMKGN